MAKLDLELLHLSLDEQSDKGFYLPLLHCRQVLCFHGGRRQRRCGCRLKLTVLDDPILNCFQAFKYRQNIVQVASIMCNLLTCSVSGAFSFSGSLSLSLCSSGDTFSAFPFTSSFSFSAAFS